MILTVEVTETDIDNGAVEDCEECPLALAVYRALVAAHPELDDLTPYVNGDSIHLFQGAADTSSQEILFTVNPLPAIASEFIRDFDGCNPYVRAFTVQLEFQEGDV